MKRSDIDLLKQAATDCFVRNGWALPPDPKWDVTDFGLGDWRRFGLVLINLAEEPEYCEKLMYARSGMVTPRHKHIRKKEDIICRWGVLLVNCWDGSLRDGEPVQVKVDGRERSVPAGLPIILEAGSRVTLFPGVYHEFVPISEECIIGEVSTANDDLNDNVFTDPSVGRFPDVQEGS